MVDAIEAERSASKKKLVLADDPGFACEVPAEQSSRKRRSRRVRQSTDEPAP